MEIADFCSAVGIPTKNDRTTLVVCWDGKALHLLGTGFALQDLKSDLWHEIAHWLLARPEDRRFYGMGCGSPLWEEPDLEPHPWLTESEHGEPIASQLGIALEARFESLESASRTARNHDWRSKEVARRTGWRAGSFARERVSHALSVIRSVDPKFRPFKLLRMVSEKMRSDEGYISC